MVALEEPFSLEAAYKLLVLVITDLAMDTVSVMDTDTDIMVMDLVTDLDMDSVMDTITTPGHRPNGMEMLLLTLQMTNTPTLLLSM